MKSRKAQEVPPVVANGASGVFRITPSGSEDESGEGGKEGEGGGEGVEEPGLHDGDILADGKTAEGNVTAAAAAEARLAAAAADAVGP
jgi:hypothetical protein